MLWAPHSLPVPQLLRRPCQDASKDQQSVSPTQGVHILMPERKGIWVLGMLAWRPRACRSSPAVRVTSVCRLPQVCMSSAAGLGAGTCHSAPALLGHGQVWLVDHQAPRMHSL